MVLDPVSGEMLAEQSKMLPMCSNNIAEYEGLILAIETAHRIGVTNLKVHSDSQLIVNQIHEKYKVKNVDLLECRSRAWAVGMNIDKLDLVWVPRERNKRADELCRIALKNWEDPLPDLSPPPADLRPNLFMVDRVKRSDKISR